MFPTLVRTCHYINHEYKNTWNILYKHSIQAWVKQSKSTVIGSPSSLCKSKENGSLGLRRRKFVNKDYVYPKDNVNPLLTWFNLRYQYTFHSFSYESRRQYTSKITTPSSSSPLKIPLDKKNKLVRGYIDLIICQIKFNSYKLLLKWNAYHRTMHRNLIEDPSNSHTPIPFFWQNTR